MLRWTELFEMNYFPIQQCKQKLYLCSTELFEIEMFLHLKITNDPTGWGSRIHWLQLCRGVRFPQWGSLTWGFSNAGALRYVEYPFLLLTLPSPLWVVAPDRVLCIGQIELNCNYAKLNSLKLTIFTFNSVSTVHLE